jgi:predicted phage terminase large subunit-like protein
MTDPRVLAAERLLAVKKATTSFTDFVIGRHPTFTFAPFQFELMYVLDKLEKRELTDAQGNPIHRVLINMPPRHAKSMIASVEFPTYYLGRNPARHSMTTSYNYELAKTMGRQVKDAINDPFTHQVFPRLEMDMSTRAVDDWRTTSFGTYVATGIGGSTTGRAANLLLIDDPVKAREDADSALQRNRVWSYYTSALTTRKQPEADGSPPIEIVIMTRWHPDDLAGRIMETKEWRQGRWLHFNYPAIQEYESEVEMECSELPPDDPRYYPKGTLLRTINPTKRYCLRPMEKALWPERFPLDELKARRELDPREFEALYQQNPYIKGGNLIKASWWRTRTEEPQIETLIAVADTAFKTNSFSDYSVIMLLGAEASGDIHIINVIRERYTFPELKRRAIMLNAQYRGMGLRGLYIEDRASGQSLIQELKTESGLAVIPYKVNTDKVSRANSITPLIEGGRVYLPESASWLEEFLNECESFPNSKHDDQVDALTMGLDIMSRLATSSQALINAPIDLNNSLYAKFRPIEHVYSSRFADLPKALGEL